MTPQWRSSRSPDTHHATLVVAVALAVLAVSAPRAAHAQACCVGTGLVTPARLRMFEDYAVGMQTSFRNVMGSFAPGGSYVASPTGDNEVDLEQDLLAATRFGRHLQVALKMPFVETGRRYETGVSAFGGGLGDVAANLRYDLTFAGDEPWWPGIAILAGVSTPTGRTVEDSRDPTGATGLGSFEPNLGAAVEQVRGRMFVSLTGFVSKQTSRTAGGVPVSFGPRFTGLLAGGYAFANEVTVGAFFTAMRRNDEALASAGAAVAVPLGDYWRVQGTLSGDLPFSGWGRNRLTGAGITASVLRVWL
jgi:hypothetical protein